MRQITLFWGLCAFYNYLDVPSEYLPPAFGKAVNNLV